VNRYRAIIAGAWALTAVAALASIVAWARAVPASGPRPLSETRTSETGVGSAAPIGTAGLAAAAGRIRDHDPFRWERKPTSVRFNPWEPVQPPPSNVRAARPALVLVGMVGGPPWTALVEGIPDRPGGVLLRVGEEAAGIRLVEVRGDTARLSGLDTTWVLTPRRTWH